MHGIQRNKKTQTILLVKDCKLSELGMCKRRFRQKTYQQDFCKPEHQQLYHKIIKKEKRLVVRLLGEHDTRIRELVGEKAMKKFFLKDLVEIIERYNEAKYELDEIKEWNEEAMIEPEKEEK